MDGCGDATCGPLPTVWPSPPPKSQRDAGVKCCQIPAMTCRVSVGLPIQPAFAIDPNAPIEVDWPPSAVLREPEVDTGPRPDLLAQIPDQIVPQVVTMMAKPTIVSGKAHDVEMNALPHELCPDSSLHTRITPKFPKKVEIRLPPQEEPIRGPPCRSWVQCVENTLLSDQVRRPMARICHTHPLPPLVIPEFKIMEMKMKSTEIERKKAEAQQRAIERECQRLKSRQRQAKWNYTVESLLDRKRAKERAKADGETQATRDLMEEVAREKKEQSDAQNAKAKQLMLYRKGLIRDFHSALGYSKMMQEIENAKTQSDGCEKEAKLPLSKQQCTQKMMYPNTSRPDYAEEHKQKLLQKKPVNQKLLQRLRNVEDRQKQHECEIQNELYCMKQMITENLPELPEKYKKYIADPVCDDEKKHRAEELRRSELFESISDKLAADAYIESAENEIDRQACEFMEYKRQVDAIRKQKEKQLIDEKVAYNIQKSEAAARVLVKMQQSKKSRENEYDSLKDQWESEWESKREDERKLKEKVMERIVADYNKRQCAAGWKRCELDPARQWARERLVAAENFERECEDQSSRRKEAEEIVLFNKALASAKHCREEKKRHLDNVWGAKMKQEYLDEMKEMKAYAKECIEDWKAKGRSTLPMHMAMKKWDYDAGMYPPLFVEDPLEQERKKRMLQYAKQSNCPPYETTSQRLGFNSGGC